MRNDEVIQREDLNNIKTEEVENPQKLLEACVNSDFDKDGYTYPVTARFIRQTANGGAIVQIRNDQGYEYVGTVSSLQDTYAYATDLDIFIDEQDNYSFVLGKSVFSNDLPTRLDLEPIPPLKAEEGEDNPLALFSHKRSSIYVDDNVDSVKYRVLYTLSHQDSVFVVRTLTDKVYTRRGPSEDLRARLVPGDFFMYQSTDDLIYQVYGMALNIYGFISPAVSPVYVEPPQT